MRLADYINHTGAQLINKLIFTIRELASYLRLCEMNDLRVID